MSKREVLELLKGLIEQSCDERQVFCKPDENPLTTTKVVKELDVQKLLAAVDRQMS